MGRGAMGSVYRAFDPVLGRQVAVKLMRTDHIEPELRAEFLGRFTQEVRAAAGCMHPAIVVVHDVGGDLVSGATVQPPFIVMELVEGGSLADRLLNPAGRAELSPQTVLLPVLDALGMVHRLEIVHRDVKPANIMLTPAGQPKLTDFGISRLTHGIGEVGLTQTGMMIGTPRTWRRSRREAKRRALGRICSRSGAFSTKCCWAGRRSSAPVSVRRYWRCWAPIRCHLSQSTGLLRSIPACWRGPWRRHRARALLRRRSLPLHWLQCRTAGRRRT